jgi:hypothetical protein
MVPVLLPGPGRGLRQLRQGLRRRKSKVRAVYIADLLRLAARDR